MSNEVANIITNDVQVETTTSKKPRYTVEISQFKNGQLVPIRIPCDIVRENETSYRVRVTFPDGEVRVIRKNKSKVFSNEPKTEAPKEAEGEKKEKRGRKKADDSLAPKAEGSAPKPKRNSRISKS